MCREAAIKGLVLDLLCEIKSSQEFFKGDSAKQKENRPLFYSNSLSAKAGMWYDADASEACIQLFRDGYRIDAANLEELAWLISPK